MQNGTDVHQEFLNSLMHNPVKIKLNSGPVYKGDLQAVDGYMNLALENCKEIQPHRTIFLGDAFIRGNNVSYISADHS